MNPTTLQIGQWVTTSDSFSAFAGCPTGAILDLNDGVTWTIEDDDSGLGRGLDLGYRPPTVYSSANPHTRGRRVVRRNYQDGRTITVRLFAGQFSSYATFNTALHNLIQTCEAVSPVTPCALKIQTTGSSTPVYADCTEAHVEVPYDELLWGQLLEEGVVAQFFCPSGMLRGARLTLQNLVFNPGFEAPSGPGVTVFNDTFANINAYSVLSGVAPSVTANVMTVPANTFIQFGSPTWSAINQWNLRFQWTTGLAFNAHLHYIDASNNLYVNVNGAALTGNQQVAGVLHQLATATATLANGAWYWLRITQFPTVIGNPANISATIYNDSAGSIGTQVATIGPVGTFDAVTALVGRPVIQVGGVAANFGGAFANVQTVALFGPGAWTWFNTGTGQVSGAWDQSTSNTYPSGPVTSFGAGRLDIGPAGTVTAGWSSYSGGAPSGTSAAPVSAAGDVLGLSVVVRSSGLHATNATSMLVTNEYDASGAFLRQTIIASAVGGTTNAAWTTLAGTLTTGVSCAYVAVGVQVADTAVPGESANGIVWFDNAQAWDSTTTGATSMPYCELRFPQSPAQLMVSGIQGDVAAPATIEMGLYLASWTTGSSLSMWLGRRAQSSAGAQLVGACVGWFGTTITTPPLVHTSAVLDATSYGGFYIKNTSGDIHGWRPRFTSMLARDCLGNFHAMMRGYTVNTTPTGVGMSFDVQQRQQAWYGLSATTNADQLGEAITSYQYGFTTQNTWTTVDSGIVTLPPFTNSPLASGAQTYVVPTVRWGVANEQDQTGWAALLPCDGEMFLATAYNPTNAVSTVTTSWLYVYWDATSTSAPFSVESAALPNAGHAGGSVGSTTTGSINVNQVGATQPMLDPTLRLTNSQGLGVNQYVLHANDNANLLLPVALDLVYSPQYTLPE